MARVAPPEVAAARNSNTDPRRLRGQNPNIGIAALAPAAQMKTAAAALNAAIKAATAAAAAKTAEVPAAVEAKGSPAGSKGSLGSSNAITAVVRNLLRPRSSVPRRKKSAVVV